MEVWAHDRAAGLGGVIAAAAVVVVIVVVPTRINQSVNQSTNSIVLSINQSNNSGMGYFVGSGCTRTVWYSMYVLYGSSPGTVRP